MSPRDKRTKRASETARLIYRQVRRTENTRFLRGLPGLGVDGDLPTHFQELLGHLQEAEQSQQRGAQRQS